MSDSYKLLAGFGMVDITPEESLPMTSYGDDLRRFSQGKLTNLYACSVAITDENGESLIFVTGDLTWAPSYVCPYIFDKIEQELGVPRDHVFLTGNHTHDSVGLHLDYLPEVARYRQKYIDGMFEAAKLALEDRKPAEVYAGSAITERMNFVRRYIMDDGSLKTDLTRGTGVKSVAHESQADPELQLLRFVREGGKDILAANFQTHPHLEGKHDKLSSQLAGAFRDEAAARMDVHCIYWNGAAGNINSKSRIAQEQRVFTDKDWAALMVDYAQKLRLHKVKAGPVRVRHKVIQGVVNHQFDHLIEDAQKIVDYYNDGHTLGEAMTFAEPFGMHSFHHASRIIANSKLSETKDILLQTYSFGDISGVIFPFEMFDTIGMHIKRNSPFQKTILNGYAWPSYVGYIPSAFAFKVGGYEADFCTFVSGTAEAMAEGYLELLEEMYNT